MNTHILDDEVQNFIFNYTEPATKLAFAGSPFQEISTQALLEQIESRRAIEKKLPLWFASKKIYYPPKLNLEQTSSEQTAKYKSNLVTGGTLADITGGFGIDAYYFSKAFKKVTHIEQNNTLSKIARHNASILGADAMEFRTGDGLETISNHRYDVLYVDPSRRNQTKGKVFLLSDCTPDLTVQLEFLMDRCETLLLKTSPMLDLAAGIGELRYVAEIHCIAVQNEVKELLWILNKEAPDTPEIKTINITGSGNQKFNFSWQQDAIVTYAPPLRFLYEPNAAILKSGGYAQVATSYKLKKLHPHSHLFTSESLREFPGRRFSIEKIVPYTKQAMRDGINFEKANITTRNFPERVATIRKKWKIKEGGNTYLFFTTLENEEKIMLICAKV